ncbi:MAG: adenylate/guanylate cyclase domain-containing protein [Actinomycetota bacterium]
MSDELALVIVRQPGRRAITVALTDTLEVGRDCDGLLIADTLASRRHVQLSRTADGVVATDLGSTNGSFLAGERIEGAVPLTPGRPLTVGGTTIEVLGDAEDRMVEPDFDPTATSIDLLMRDVDRSPLDPTQLGYDGGTVTIVFSDIESSTERSVALGDAAWYQVLERHNTIVRDRLRARGGSEIKNQGDGFMLTFPSARAAVRCMIEIQQDLAAWATEDGDAVRVRMGAHVGEAIHDQSGDLFGTHVVIAARIAGMATGAQILISDLTKTLVETRGDIRLGPPESVELKGLGSAHVVHEVDWTGPTST